MGIKRTVEVRVLQPPGSTLAALREGAESAGMTVRDESMSGFAAAAKRSLLKNRWAAEIRVHVQPSADATVAAITVDMAGTKHLSLVNELTEPLAGQIDDRGLNEAKERLASRAGSSACWSYELTSTCSEVMNGLSPLARASLTVERAWYA